MARFYNSKEITMETGNSTSFAELSIIFTITFHTFFQIVEEIWLNLEEVWGFSLGRKFPFSGSPRSMLTPVCVQKNSLVSKLTAAQLQKEDVSAHLCRKQNCVKNRCNNGPNI